MPASSNLPAGNHNPGLDCMSCHNGQMVGAPAYSIAGTLFAPSGTPLAGATVLITDSNSNSFTLVTASNGNFYTGSAVALPLTALGVSDCAGFGSGLYMASEMPVAATTAAGAAAAFGASCNNCHVAGQDAPPLHLP
jgi:cytochrome c5